jgi:hypothetical protein
MVELGRSAWKMLTRQAVCYNVMLRRVRLTVVVVEKAISIAYSQCVSLALVIRHAKRMRRCILSTVFRLAVQNLSTFSHKRDYFRKKRKLLNVKCVF